MLGKIECKLRRMRNILLCALFQSSFISLSRGWFFMSQSFSHFFFLPSPLFRSFAETEWLSFRSIWIYILKPSGHKYENASAKLPTAKWERCVQSYQSHFIILLFSAWKHVAAGQLRNSNWNITSQLEYPTQRVSNSDGWWQVSRISKVRWKFFNKHVSMHKYFEINFNFRINFSQF